MSKQVSLEDIVSLCKRRGFIFQGSEIYGGLSGTWDYGPLGIALKRRLMNYWWYFFVDNRDDMYGVDAAILMPEKVWEASGHLAGFKDPMVVCKKCHSQFRADHLIEDALEKNKHSSNAPIHEAHTGTIDNLNTNLGVFRPSCPKCGTKDAFSESMAKQFNMMLKTQMGAVEGEGAVAYLRPETAQGIFTNFKNVVDSMQPELPFGIGQQGKAFRNEISPRDFIFRSREFEQMEIEYFVHPDQWEKAFDSWIEYVYLFLNFIGIHRDKVSELEVPEQDRAHYSKRTIDFEFDYPIGRKELLGLAYRTDFDLRNHSKVSNKTLEYRPKDGGDPFIPHVIEPSFGVERLIMAILVSSYFIDNKGDESRIVLKLPPHLAPYKVAVSPLLRNKPELVEKAQEVYVELKKTVGYVTWDDNGNIGKRYRRQDEIGTPYCIVIDFQTLEDGTVTIRDRDTSEQKRIDTAQLAEVINASL